MSPAETLRRLKITLYSSPWEYITDWLELIMMNETLKPPVSVSGTNDVSSLICSRRGLWCGMCPSQITPVQSVLWSQNQEGRCVCVWLIWVWVLWGARMGCPLLPPLLHLTLGGSYLVMWAPGPPPSPGSPIWSPEPNPAAMSGQPPHLHPGPD